MTVGRRPGQEDAIRRRSRVRQGVVAGSIDRTVR